MGELFQGISAIASLTSAVVAVLIYRDKKKSGTNPAPTMADDGPIQEGQVVDSIATSTSELKTHRLNDEIKDYKEKLDGIKSTRFAIFVIMLLSPSTPFFVEFFLDVPLRWIGYIFILMFHFVPTLFMWILFGFMVRRTENKLRTLEHKNFE